MLCLAEYDKECYKSCNEICSRLREGKPFNFYRGIGNMSPDEYATENYHQQAVEYREHAVGLEHLHTAYVGTQVERHRLQELVDNQDAKNFHLAQFVAQAKRYNQRYCNVNYCQYKSECQQVGKTFVEQVAVLGDIAVVEVGDAHVEDDVEQKREVEQRKIYAELLGADNILHRTLNPEYPERLYQDIEEEKET